MKIAVLEMGLLPPTLAERHGGFFELIRTWLLGHAQAGVDLKFSQFVVCDGGVLPEPSDFDAYVISGSKHSVYEDLPWIQDTKVFLNRLADLHIPMFGICFGHQLMAEAFGGKVEKSNKGWGIGTDVYQFANRTQEVLVVHQDQVTVLPTSVQVQAQSAHCDYGVLQYDFPACSAQFHPEFTQALVLDLLVRGRGDFGEEVAAGAEQKTGQAQLNNAQFADEVVAFFQQHQHMVNEV